MKKSTLFIAAAALMFAGCASDDLTPGANVNAGGASSTIGFGFNVPNQTRGTLSGEAAAEKLGKEFVVYGTKHTQAENGAATNDAVVFQNYRVQYTANSANTTETNTHNWEYNGLTPYGSTVAPSLGDNQKQTVKYWDYSAANGYTFTAFAAKEELANNRISVTKLTADAGSAPSKYNKGYKVSLKKDANLENVFYSDRVEVDKKNYGSPVVLTFRNFGTRVRVGFYETVPGYSVKIDKFYYGDAAITPVADFASMSHNSENEFKAASYHVAQDPGTNTNNELTVTYQTSGTVQNQPTVANTTCTYENTLTLGGGVVGTELGTSSTSPTWDTNGNYTTVYPNEACANPMLIRCDYTLTSTDGSNEKITVKNARVVVPAEYLKWKPNFAYTYLFKISDKTNGTTGDDSGTSSDPEGLHPITFDAVVVDAATGNQETVSGLTTNSVTTYANGSQVTANGEYKSGEDIYVVNQSTTGTHEVITPKAIGDANENAQVYELSVAATEGEVYAQLNGAKLTGLTMNAVSPAATQVTTIPLSDGTSLTINAVKFTPTVTAGATAKYYAYVYTNTKYVAPTYDQVATDATYSDITTYYFKTTSGVYYTASGIDEASFLTYKAKSALYTQKTTGTPGVYDIKVITVKP